ncbi:MAG: ankyrin repeat domain-containing protein [Bryobacteraceae bacterium]|jgi:ankyrin repeat protein
MQEFFDAIRSGDEQRVRTLAESDPSLLAAKDEHGLGPFTVARYSRQNAIADYLLTRGVELDIFAACLAGCRERVAELLAQDHALLNAHSHDGWTPLHLAAFFGFADIAGDLLAAGADVKARSLNAMRNTPLHAAVAGNSVAVTRALLEHGADVNAPQEAGWTPLHGAAQNGNAELIQLLIAAGATVSTRADNGQTPADLALTRGHQAAVDILEKY